MTKTDPSTGCEYEISFCYACGVTGFDPHNIRNVVWKPIQSNSGTSCLGLDEATKDWVWLELRTWFLNYASCNVVACSTSGGEANCNNSHRIDIIWPLCVQIHNEIYWDESSMSFKNYAYWTTCEEPYCYTSYWVCIDFTKSPPEYKECNFIDGARYGDLCPALGVGTIGEWQPPYPLTWSVPFITGCLHIFSGCDG